MLQVLYIETPWSFFYRCGHGVWFAPVLYTDKALYDSLAQHYLKWFNLAHYLVSLTLMFSSVFVIKLFCFWSQMMYGVGPCWQVEFVAGDYYVDKPNSICWTMKWILLGTRLSNRQIVNRLLIKKSLSYLRFAKALSLHNTTCNAPSKNLYWDCRVGFTRAWTQCPQF